MGAASSAPKLKAALNDQDPAVALAAAHSLFVLGEREDVYDLDYHVLMGERKSADGFVRTQIKELKDPKAVAMMGVETGIGFMPFEPVPIRSGLFGAVLRLSGENEVSK